MIPVHKKLKVGAFSGVKSSLSLLAALFLKFPSVISVEIDHTNAIEAIFLTDNISEVDIRVSSIGIGDCITSVVRGTNRASSQVI